ncbi:MAG: 16S rRNA (guanine(966)-N(2))-methyltransferase RsmD [Bacillaceae bacterium]|nr:16S rRNA (guanine(966)-N(2))-methyltransferase RsmD [Bacillaceae bacterium]
MRVISGTCGGRSLKAVPGTTTRPTTDKVKESIFNMIGPFFQGGLGLDLYGGSGGLGIEALSRGFDKMIFVDQNAKAIDIITSNLNLCKLFDKAEVYRNDARRALKAIIKRQMRFDAIFLDPPYKKQRLEEELMIISENRLLLEEGVIVVEHDAAIALPESINTLVCERKEQYGDTVICLYRIEIR